MHKGQERINWAAGQMPVLNKLRERFILTKPFRNIKISACLHVTAETANLVKVLIAGGAEVALAASNPLSTQDDVVAALKKQGVNVFAKHGASNKIYYDHIRACLKHRPNLTVDDGADLVTYLHTKSRSLLKNIIGGTEETTTGVVRLQAMATAKKLKYPIIAVNNALTKHLFDNRYGTGQSTFDGIMRATNILLAGKVVVVSGFGWCGRGVVMRARGLGARVIVTEVDPIRALEALMDGNEVMPLTKALPVGDIFITTTGDRDIITRLHFYKIKDKAILANAGHFNVEIDVAGLAAVARSVKQVRENLTEYLLKSGKKIYLIGEGRLANLAAAEGHPGAVMDLSFANQALSLEYLVINRGRVPVAVMTVPEEIDKKIAGLKLESIGVKIDKLTDKQNKYLKSWHQGT